MTNRPGGVFGGAISLAVICLLFGASPAEAYIDPGTGSLAYQVVLAAALGAVFFVRRLRASVAAVIRRMVKPPSSERPHDPA